MIQSVMQVEKMPVLVVDRPGNFLTKDFRWVVGHDRQRAASRPPFSMNIGFARGRLLTVKPEGMTMGGSSSTSVGFVEDVDPGRAPFVIRILPGDHLP